MEILDKSNMLLIAGTGRNSGKTTFACRIISRFCAKYPIIAVKISAHFHENVEAGKIICSRENIFIGEETNPLKSKDSSRMLAAGARKSFFVMASDNQVPDALHILLTLIGPDYMIVCESGGLRNFIKPGLFFMLHRSDNSTPKPESIHYNAICDRWITFDGIKFDLPMESIDIKSNKWILKHQ